MQREDIRWTSVTGSGNYAEVFYIVYGTKDLV